MVVSAAKKKARIKAQLEREWGQKAYAYGNASDYKSDHADRFCKVLKAAGCKCVVLGSIRREYAVRDYVNVWTSCRNADKLLRGR
jgi:hypothetical protein